MKKVLSILLALSLILGIGAAMAADSKKEDNIAKTTVTTTTTSTSTAPAAEPDPTHAQLKTNSAHLRETPGGKYNIANDWTGAGTTLELAGDPVTADGTTWYPVIYDGKVWYVADYVIDLVVGAGTAPAAKKTTRASSSSGWTGTGNTASEQEEEASLKLILVSDTSETAAVIKACKDAFTAGNVLTALPDEAKSKLTAGNSTINEMVTAQFVGDTSLVTGSVLVNVKFDTLYSPAGATVDVLFVKGAWNVLAGAVQADGSINVTLGKDLISSLKNDPFVLGVVSQ